MPELLAPAGNMECLKTALHFGADAVYIGGDRLQLRSDRAGFGMEDLARAAELLHGAGKRLYVTVNSFASNAEAQAAGDYARELRQAGADAAIISDIGVFSAFRAAEKDMELHISTQASCMNYLAARTYWDMGAARVILAREMTLEDIALLRAKTPAGLVLEVFVHGAMCMAFSGRCLISSYLAARSGNRGDCAQPCRWSYSLMEEKRPGEYFPIEETEKGSAILSSHDLCCADILPALDAAGAGSFKIEGRMKTEYYVGTVVNAYRMAMDSAGEAGYIAAELDTVSHRPYSHGFYFGAEAAAPYNDGLYRQSRLFAGVVRGWADGVVTLEQRNNFKVGQYLEAVSPGQKARRFKIESITNQEGESQSAAHLVKQLVSVPCPFPLKPGDLLRFDEIIR